MLNSSCFADFLFTHSSISDEKDAVIYEDEIWSYGRLKQKISIYKKALKDISVLPGERVIVQMEAEPAAIAMSLAIMSKGAIYVPIATDIPTARLFSIIESIDPTVIVSSSQSTVNYSAVSSVEIDTLKLHRKYSLGTNIGADQQEKDAYIIMTSGTTGTPKGIAMTHAAAIAAVKGYQGINISPHSRVGSISPLHFDFCIFDMAITFHFGATFVLVPKILALHAKGFVRYLAERRVTRMHSVPSVWRPVLDSTDASLLDGLQYLEGILYAAESFPVKDLLALQKALPSTEFIQSFGHTESMGCCFKKLNNPVLPHNGHISIGKPLLNTEMFALNEQGYLTQPDEVGELYVKGPHLFRGYWRDTEQTNRRIVNDPRGGDGLVFKSGDLVFQDTNGDFYFVGRNDHQVKIGGNRVELPEIDRVVNEITNVSAAATIINENLGKQVMECFVAKKGDISWNDLVSKIRKEITQVLPRYMHPNKFYFVSSLPLLSNGKVDRATLRDVQKRKALLIN